MSIQARALVKYVRTSPYKLRPLAAVVRGNNVEQALAWLRANATQRTRPIEKIIFSAFANAKVKHGEVTMRELVIKEIKVDQGPTITYFKPGAMGRANPQRKRMSHIEVVVEKPSQQQPTEQKAQ